MLSDAEKRGRYDAGEDLEEINQQQRGGGGFGGGHPFFHSGGGQQFHFRWG